MSKIATAGKKILSVASKKSPIIFTVCAVAFGTAAVGSAIVATVKATKKVQKMKEAVCAKNGKDISKSDEIEIEPKEIVKVVWKDYIPTLALTLTAGIFAFKGHGAFAAQMADLASVCKLSEVSSAKLGEKLIAEVGEKRAKDIQDEVTKEVNGVKAVPMMSGIIDTGEGSDVIKDPWSGRFFKSSSETITNACAELSGSLYGDDKAVLNDFYDLVGLPHTKAGNFVGWCVRSLKRSRLSAELLPNTDDYGNKYYILCFDTEPSPGYTWE